MPTMYLCAYHVQGRDCSFVVLRDGVLNTYCATKLPLDVTLTHMAVLALTGSPEDTSHLNRQFLRIYAD